MDSSDCESATSVVDVCCVCGDVEGTAEDELLVYCDGILDDNQPCSVAVHPHCCGAPLSNHIPENSWYCDTCTAKKNHPQKQQPKCVLCADNKGLLKKTTCGRWAHIACALWLPEAFFVDAEYREPIDVLHIPEYRWDQTCQVCGSSDGACLECSDPNCANMFHARCAIERDLWMQYKPATRKGSADVIVALCSQHSEKWKRECASKGIRYN
jgi:NuA3 HAT complex component NTO1